MPRVSKGPRLWKRPARRKDGKIIGSAVWIIKDGDKHIATGCLASPAQRQAPAEAEQALARYIAEKHQPQRRNRDIEEIDVADVLSIYLSDFGDDLNRFEDFDARIDRLNKYWGGKMLSEINTQTCNGYVAHRAEIAAARAVEAEKAKASKDGREAATEAVREKAASSTGGARRDLEALRAAINHHGKQNFHYGVVNVVLPSKGGRRERWLERSEAARLLWACYRHREVQTVHIGKNKGNAVTTTRRPLRHIARFILIGLYTGSRAGAIASASPYQDDGRSFVDLDHGVFYRLARGSQRTNKRQPPAPLPDRLLVHMRRWVRLGIVKESFVEWNGKPIASVKKGFGRGVALAKLSTETGNVTPHTLRHTAATWMMLAGADPWRAAGWLGMSVEVLLDVYGHHHPTYLRGAARNVTAKPKRDVAVVETVVDLEARRKMMRKA